MFQWEIERTGWVVSQPKTNPKNICTTATSVNRYFLSMPKNTELKLCNAFLDLNSTEFVKIWISRRCTWMARTRWFCLYYHPERSWGKVIFSQASVILLTGGLPAPRGVSAPGGVYFGGVPGGDPPRDGHCCGRYASYWNAFLFNKETLT